MMEDVSLPRNEECAGEYFQLKTPAYDYAVPEFLAFVEQPNLLIYRPSVPVQLFFNKKMTYYVFLVGDFAPVWLFLFIFANKPIIQLQK